MNWHPLKKPVLLAALGVSVLGISPTYVQAEPNAVDFNIMATPGANSLSTGNRIRGFGDSTEVDTWVPFTISIPREHRGFSRAQIVMVVKPIGQIIGTDSLILKGASGTAHVVYDKFSSLPTDTFTLVRVDIANEDVLAAIRSGTLEGVIQDDTAVQSVRMLVE